MKYTGGNDVKMKYAEETQQLKHQNENQEAVYLHTGKNPWIGHEGVQEGLITSGKNIQKDATLDNPYLQPGMRQESHDCLEKYPQNIDDDDDDDDDDYDDDEIENDYLQSMPRPHIDEESGNDQYLTTAQLTRPVRELNIAEECNDNEYLHVGHQQAKNENPEEFVLLAIRRSRLEQLHNKQNPCATVEYFASDESDGSDL